MFFQDSGVKDGCQTFVCTFSPASLCSIRVASLILVFFPLRRMLTPNKYILVHWSDRTRVCLSFEVKSKIRIFTFTSFYNCFSRKRILEKHESIKKKNTLYSSLYVIFISTGKYHFSLILLIIFHHFFLLHTFSTIFTSIFSSIFTLVCV